MRLALIGSKQKVKGFDIDLHNKLKLGSLVAQPQQQQ